MGTVAIPYLVVRERHGKHLAYWRPAPTRKEPGFALMALEPDGPGAWRNVKLRNEQWQAYRKRLKKAEEPG